MKWRLHTGNHIPITALCFRLFYGNLAHRLVQSHKTGVSSYYAATTIVKACPPSPVQRSRRSDTAQCNKNTVFDNLKSSVIYVLLTVHLDIIVSRKTNFVYFVSLYMFGAYLGPSSGGTTICIQQFVLIILFRLLSVVLVGQVLLMMGLDTPETCRGWRNVLRISCVSGWFFFTRFKSSLWLLKCLLHHNDCSHARSRKCRVSELARI
jgi:hypothetical protein